MCFFSIFSTKLVFARAFKLRHLAHTFYFEIVVSGTHIVCVCMCVCVYIYVVVPFAICFT